MLHELARRLGIERNPQEVKTPRREPFVFLAPDGSVPFVLASKVEEIRECLEDDLATAWIMEAILEGPNVGLYQGLIEQIKDVEVDEETGERLAAAASSLFFGNKITDARIELMIRYGGAVPARDVSGFDLFELSVVYDPERILLEERVAEIWRGDFSLPQNTVDLDKNARLQIERVSHQLDSGILERKALSLGLSAEKGRSVGNAMIDSPKDLCSYFIPGVETDTSSSW